MTGGLSTDGMLTVGELADEVRAGAIDTVVVAITDMQGRLQGKRCDARFFLDHVLAGATEGCNYLLAVDVEMTTVDGYAMSSWERGYGDFVMRPDPATLRRVPWHPGTALCHADVEWEDASPVTASPRQVLRRQVARLAERGWTGCAGTELEFIVFRESYEEAWSRGYRGLTPSTQYNVDYSVLGTARMEPLLRRLRLEMAGAGMQVESAKGECNLGQFEIAFLYSGLLEKADEHVLYKSGAKEIAAQEGISLSFMAKFDEREGNSCHVHVSVRDGAGTPVFVGDDPNDMSPTFEHFLAGLLATTRELTLLYAPNINSYKRFAPGSFAPTALVWGRDNRTCSYRVVGHGPGLRVETRIPGGDVNPYLTLAALVAGGLHGVDHQLALEAPFAGNAYVADGLAHVPRSLAEATALFEASAVARSAFGDDVVDHYVNMARVELDAFGATVTDWERYRGFERL
ncbi:MAG TPA: glutamine synthetase family protein [Acidimicrobiales bacterium]|nr:glutamine synthetase family protein [Acidimicrobiales bacterium]